MRKLVIAIIALGPLTGGRLAAQELAGAWQGTLATEIGPLRTVLEISPVGEGKWKVVLFSVDQSGFDHGVPASSMTMNDSALTISFDQIEGSYAGTLHASGFSMSGTWTQNNVPSPLDFQRATNETLWRDPLASTSAARAAVQGAAKPSFATLWRQLCGATLVPYADTGVIVGHVARLGMARDTGEYVQAAWVGDSVVSDSAAPREPPYRVRTSKTTALMPCAGCRSPSESSFAP